MYVKHYKQCFNGYKSYFTKIYKHIISFFFIKHRMTKAFVKIGTNFIMVPTHPVIYTFYKSTSQKDHANAFIGNNFAVLRSPMDMASDY